MTGSERLHQALAGTLKSDERRAVALWRAMPEASPYGSAFVRAVLETAEMSGTDLIKVPCPLAEVAPQVRLTDLAQITRLASELNGAAVVATVGQGDTPEWVRAAIEEVGCAGIYLPLHKADPALLAAASAGWCNIVHLHGADALERWDRALWEKAQVLSWAERGEGISPSLVRERIGSGHWCVMGGVNERSIAGRSPDAVRMQAISALHAFGDEKRILAPDCTPPPGTPTANLRALREAAEAEAERVRHEMEHPRKP